MLFLTGCASLPRASFTAADQAAAVLPGLGDVRIFADAPAAAFKARDPGLKGAIHGKAVTYLALSGGGSNGAYGAGVLNGWTATGSRPEFTLVSGVSTGALIAPFAFLGPRYDGVLKAIYTSGIAETILDSPSLLNVVFGSGLFGNGRLRELVARFVDEQMLALVSTEHAKGRRLLVVTTNLDAQRAVIWDMGRIASSGSPKALSLFRDVLTASASIPAVFPPMFVDAEAKGRRFQEMHVDGGVIAPVLTLPEAFLLRSAMLKDASRASLYVLMNNKVEPSFEVVASSTAEIAGRSLSTVTKTQTRSVIFGTYNFARRNGIKFNITYLDRNVSEKGGEGFDTAYMRRLYEHGYAKARSGRLWEQAPPTADPGPPQR